MANNAKKEKTGTKKTSTSKSSTPQKKSSSFKNMDRRLLVIMLVSLCISFVLGYMMAGLILGVFCTFVLAFFLLIARFLDSTSSKKRQRKIVNTLFIIFLILMISGTLGVVGFLGYVVMKAPTFDVNRLVNKESSIFYDSEGNEIIKLGSELRENVEYSHLPEVLVDALVATEDSRFFQHNGFDAPRFLVATLKQVAGNDKDRKSVV